MLNSYGLDDLDGVTRLVNFFTVLGAGCMSVPTNFPSPIRAGKFIRQKASSDHQTGKMNCPKENTAEDKLFCMLLGSDEMASSLVKW